MHALHAEHEDRHWWYAARRRIVLALLRSELRAAPPRRPLDLLDVGCGAGGLLKLLSEFGTAVGVDPEPAAVQHARKANVSVHLGSLPNALPFASERRFDVITILDVLEHVEEDTASLQTLYALLRPGGVMLVTVPAFRFLWSGHDVVNEHKRRYTRRDLSDKLVATGFDIRVLSYYNTLLFPPIAVLRMVRRLFARESESPDTGVVREPFNTVLREAFAAERHVLGRVRLPFGVSLIAVVRKPEANSHVNADR